MNPDYMKRQDNPDGKNGHVEREKIYKNVKQDSVHDAELSQRLDNAIYNDNTPLSVLQVEIRMKQCILKTGECYQKDCINCMEYKIA